LKLKYLYKSDWALSAIKVALIIGSILCLINHGKAMYDGAMTLDRWISVFLSYLVPYCVYIIGKASNLKDTSETE